MTRAMVLTLAVLLGLPASARAAAALDYAASEPCPSKLRFADEVTAKLGFSPWGEAGPTVRVRIQAADGGGFIGTLASPNDHERHFAADSCRKVADLLVTAVAIALDHTDRAATVAPANGTASAMPRLDDPVGGTPLMQETLSTWSFAPRNNLFQLGLGYVSSAGPELAGAVPLGTGHLELGVAYMSSNSEFVDITTEHAHAYYLYPVFYFNKDSAFEMPIYAGGGLGVQRYATKNSTGAMTTSSDTEVLPTLEVGNSIQFNGLPVEFAFRMQLDLVSPPGGQSSFGVDVMLRYVFGHKKRDVVRWRDL
ncbi:MAG TPA: hypothetical protein VLX92_21655 [Kofleriaceae bacterium]|nr:hypothetical protein [Kofleriaceae bacterium]